MKVAVICSNGKVGKLVVKEALAAGFEVTGFARGENKSEAKKYVQKDIFDITKQDLTGFNFVVDRRSGKSLYEQRAYSSRYGRSKLPRHL